jgi:SAM-dependent methyltransferase
MTDSSEIWTGVAGAYDRARPSPPPALLDLLTRLIRTPRPALVVDLGSGTGLSAALWGERADRVIGIEPNADMRREAVRKLGRHSDAARVEYRAGVAEETGLPDECADIVTAAQAFHWMEPTATLAEIGRMLRPGGIFAAYDYDWPPAIHWELDRVTLEISERLVALMRERGLASNLKIWPKDRHLERMRESGRFRFTREALLHHVEQGDAARFLELTRSTAFSRQLPFTDEELGTDRLREATLRSIGADTVPWHVSCRVRIGVK